MTEVGSRCNSDIGLSQEISHLQMLMVAVPYLLRQLKATLYTQEMAPQSMELSTPLMIMRWKKSSEVVIYMEVDEPCMVH